MRQVLQSSILGSHLLTSKIMKEKNKIKYQGEYLTRAYNVRLFLLTNHYICHVLYSSNCKWLMD